MHRQPAARKLVRSRNKSRLKVQRRNSQTVFKNNILEATKKSTLRAKRIIAHKTISPSSLIIGLEIEQFALVPLSVYNSSNNPTIITKQQLPRNKPEKTLTYHKDTLKKEINQQLSTSASPPVNKFLESARIKVSNSNILILDGIEIGVLLKDFAQRLKRKNVPVPDIYSTLLDEASVTPDIVVNSHAKGKERGPWIPFNFWTTKVAETLHARVCSIWFCAQFRKRSETLSCQRSVSFFNRRLHILGSLK